jgi:putative oxidoreductase
VRFFNTKNIGVRMLRAASSKRSELSTRVPIARWAPIPLRLIVGYGFIEHGFSKLSKGPDAFATILQGIGVPGPHFMAWLTILVELLGGLAVILGAFIALVSFLMAAMLLTAMFSVHLPYGFLSIKLIAVTAVGAQFGPPGYAVASPSPSCRSVVSFDACGMAYLSPTHHQARSPADTCGVFQTIYRGHFVSQRSSECRHRRIQASFGG